MTADEWLDVSTGEVIGDSAIIRKARQLKGALAWSPFDVRWCKLSMVAVAKVAKLGLGALETRVLLYVLSSIRDGNLIDVNQSSIARELGSYQPNVSKALANLVAANALERTDGAESSGFTVYRVSPHLAWYGPDTRAHVQACKTAPPLAIPAA
jgi:hypothetical protein